MEKRGIKIAAQNRKAHHDYFVEDRYEAGIELAGTEVKSIRQGRVNLKDSYCVAKDGEIYAHSMHISPYEQGNIFNKDPDRPKRLLMHKREIRKLHDLQKQDGYALIPLSLYFKDSRVKVELGLCIKSMAAGRGDVESILSADKGWFIDYDCGAAGSGGGHPNRFHRRGAGRRGGTYGRTGKPSSGWPSWSVLQAIHEESIRQQMEVLGK